MSDYWKGVAMSLTRQPRRAILVVYNWWFTRLSYFLYLLLFLNGKWRGIFDNHFFLLNFSNINGKEISQIYGFQEN